MMLYIDIMTTNIAKKMLWNEIEVPDTVSHIACHRLNSSVSTTLHTHDFTELFWGIHGDAVHEINGITSKVDSHELFFIRAGDVHNLSVSGSGIYIFNNLAFRNTVLEELNARYNSQILQQWASRGTQAIKYRLTQPLFQWLNAAVTDVFSHRTSRLVLDYFLINLIYELEKQQKTPFENCPAWLNQACIEVFKPETFKFGASVFAKLTGYTQEHVARELKKYTGKTPTEIINEARLQHAAMLLITSARSISDISEECGFESLSYFFAAFKRRFGATPRGYRVKNLIFN